MGTVNSVIGPICRVIKLISEVLNRNNNYQLIIIICMHVNYHKHSTVYRIIIRENFQWIKFSPSPATFVLQKKLVVIRQCGKVCHILYAIFNTGQKISKIKFSPMIAGGKMVKFSTYMVPCS